jgi:recombination protein RecR
MDSIHKLTELFKEFPGIGPRQAKRFVYFLLSKNSEYRKEITELISELRDHIRVCSSCFRFFPSLQTTNLCPICHNKNRDQRMLMIVPRDVDLETVEKSHAFNGLYFVLGGTIPILDKEPEKRIRLKELKTLVQSRAEKGILKEIVLGMNANPEGEHTGETITHTLSPLIKTYNIKISVLGRGLSTGTELEYADSDTIESALKNRK